MKIVLVAAAGNIGSRILREALSRGHSVTALVRHPSKLTLQDKSLSVQKGDIFDQESVATIARGHDVIVSSYGPGQSDPGDPALYSTAAHSLIGAAKKAGVKRLLVVGGAGSLYVGPGKQLVDTPEFPKDWKPGASGLRDALEVFKKEKELAWTFFSPAIMILPGTRTGTFRLGKDEPVYDANGESRVSIEDFAVAMIDEIEKPQFVRQRFTIGY